MNSYRREEAGAAAWVLWIAFLTIIVVAIIGGAIFGIRWITADPKGKLQAREQIKSGSARIVAYDHFFNLCASVQTNERSLEAQYDSLLGTKGDEHERITANIAGLLAARADGVNQYNADAHKDYTIGQFRSSQLPYQLPTDYHKGDHTTCVA